MNKNSKIIAGGAAALLALGLGVASIGATSAYFSDTNTGGAVTVSLGSIKVKVDGSNSKTPDILLEGLLPGDTATGGYTVENSGKSTQDVYMAFPKDLQLKLINSLGTYAEIEITVDGKQVFFSDNLNDGYPGNPDVTPLPKELLLVEGLQAGQEVDVEFSLKIAEKWESQVGLPVSLDYDVVATQPGIAPGA